MKVICTLPNASDEISGVNFVIHDRGMLSEDLDEERASYFLSIPGYEPEEVASPDPAPVAVGTVDVSASTSSAADAAAAAAAAEASAAAEADRANAVAAAAEANAIAEETARRKAEADAQLDELAKRAEAVGLKFKRSWSIPRATQEVIDAEKAFADAAAAAKADQDASKQSEPSDDKQGE